MGEPPSSSNVSGTLVTAIASVLTAALVFAGGFATAWYAFRSKDEELHVHLVEIAIGILRADPKEDVVPARGWALDVIDEYSGVKFTAEDRRALLHKPLNLSSEFWQKLSKKVDVIIPIVPGDENGLKVVPVVPGAEK